MVFLPVSVRLGIALCAISLFAGAYLSFFPVWLKARGFDAEQIGLIFAAVNLLRVFTTPVAGILADARNDRRSVVVVLALGCTVFWTTATLSPWLALIATAAVMGALCHAGIGPLVEAATMRLAEPYGFDYGTVRLFGSLAFIGSTAGAGYLVGAFGIDVLMPALIVTLVLTIGAGLLLPAGIGERARGSAFSAGLARTLREAEALVRHPTFLIFLGAASCVQASHAFYYVFFTLTLEADGYARETIGLLTSLGVAAEVVLFAFARPLFARVGALRLLLIGSVLAAIRWAILAFLPAWPLVVVAQILHAASFGAAHLGAMQFILKATPDSISSTAQSLYAITAFGIVMAFGSFVSGFLFETVGALGFLAMSGLALVSAACAIVLAAHWEGGQLTPRAAGV
ncbi:MAG: MFS transporter [Alphaproteobacteria bacterium]|nr:MFS transporter [Alphaproteobacteria bacterium]